MKHIIGEGKFNLDSWFSSCVPHGAKYADPDQSYDGLTVQVRCQRAYDEAVDKMYEIINRAYENSLQDENSYNIIKEVEAEYIKLFERGTE